MKSKHTLTLIVAVLAIVAAYGQSSQSLNGRIVYEQKVAGKSNYVEMWFNGNEYVYRTTNQWDTLPEPPNFAGYVSNSDDLTALNDQLQQYTFKYSTIGSAVQIITSPLSKEKGYCVADTLGQITWQLQPETQAFSNRTCNKAVGTMNGGISFIAWYDASLPTACAPFQFRGLPGLLIRLESVSTGNTLQMVQLNYPLKQAVAYKGCPVSKLVSLEQVKKLQDQENQRLLELVEKIKKKEITNIKQMEQ
ncbi:MAG TPA: GLPGLI family protein [Phnomibacter sp.]|nr:GLPGLI family protein [Phnomibacter sp.]